jgi:hypothetical protein
MERRSIEARGIAENLRCEPLEHLWLRLAAHGKPAQAIHVWALTQSELIDAVLSLEVTALPQAAGRKRRKKA